MRKHVSLLGLLSFVVLLSATAAHAQGGREEGRLLTASQVLEELRAAPDDFIPQRLLDRAYGIAVVPDMTKAAFFFGGRRGNGVMVLRDKQGRFTNPIFMNVTGGSFGLQWGVQSTDMVLVFTSQRSIDRLTGGKLTLGADASVAAGPLGRQASAATDLTFSSEVYSYSRNRGLFGGIALDGTALTIDELANARFYDKAVSMQDILNGTAKTQSESAKRFLAAVNTSTGAPVPATASIAPVGTTQPMPAVSSGSAAPSTTQGGAKTFPMEDPKPGQDPPR
jgi:lipid-binding SYLF domain-containing protein